MATEAGGPVPVMERTGGGHEVPPRDALGRVHAQAGEGARIVSLVPSLTELLIDLGLAGQVAGRTGFCIHPREAVRDIPKVGGTKTPDIARIRELAPTHLVVNIDENERPAVEALSAFVPHVIVTHPMGPEDNRDLYRLLGHVFDRRVEADALVARLDDALARARAAAAARPPVRVLYAIWRDPWMTVGADTYVARTLEAAGLRAVDPRPAAARDATRYPAFDFDAVDWEGVDALLLSTEPYSFLPRHAATLQADPRLARTVVTLVDGEAASWYGSRAIGGLAGLTAFAGELATRVAASRNRRR